MEGWMERAVRPSLCSAHPQAGHTPGKSGWYRGPHTTQSQGPAGGRRARATRMGRGGGLSPAAPAWGPSGLLSLGQAHTACLTLQASRVGEVGGLALAGRTSLWLLSQWL